MMNVEKILAKLVSFPILGGESNMTILNWIKMKKENGHCGSKKWHKKGQLHKIKDRDKFKKYVNDNKKLLGDYVSEEELWACTSCNACVEECPISINPLSIIMDMRRNLVMEDSSAPSELNNMMSNIENNGAPCPYNQQDRLNWNE